MERLDTNAKSDQTSLPKWWRKSFSMSALSSLHRRAGLILFIQVMIWTISGFYFSWQGREALTATQHLHSLPAKPLQQMQTYVNPDIQLQRLHDVRSVTINLVDSKPRIEAYYVPSRELGHEVHPSKRNIYGNAVAWFDGETGHRWQTSAITAQRLAVDSYSGSGMFNGIKDIHRSSEFPAWAGPGFEVQFADELNTRVYIDQSSGVVIGHRNDPWKIADWMYRLHFMDYSGNRDFNNLLIISAGLFSVWFVLTGIMMLWRVWWQGKFVARSSLPYNTQLRSKRIPLSMADDNQSQAALPSDGLALNEIKTEEPEQVQPDSDVTSSKNVPEAQEAQTTSENDNNPQSVEPKN